MTPNALDNPEYRDMATQTGVKPILVSNFAWTEFLKNVAELCSHSPIQGIDSYQYQLKDYARLIAVLGEFRSGKECDPKQILYSAGDLLSHLHFGFMISGSSGLIYQIMELTDLKIISTRLKEKRGRAAIVSGTLRQWRDAIINILLNDNNNNRELRWAFSQCLNFFSHLGLNDIWHDYRKLTSKDQIYLLERK